LAKVIELSGEMSELRAGRRCGGHNNNRKPLQGVRSPAQNEHLRKNRAKGWVHFAHARDSARRTRTTR
jgi:hypothetical protein